MSYHFPPEVDHLVRERMASGQYESEDALLIRALRLLAEYEQGIVDIQAGIHDLDAGRIESLQEVDAKLRRKHQIPREA